MREFWFTYLAKAVIVFLGGYGTLDELFEVLALMLTHKIKKHLPVVLFGDSYRREVVNLDALVRYGTIGAKDLDLIYRTDSIDDAYSFVVDQLTQHAIADPDLLL